MTDTRSERHPGERTMLGARQLAWLIAELERAARDPVALLVWVNTVPWIAADGDGDGWGQFAAERSLIGERIVAPRPRPAHGDDERRCPHAGVRRRPEQRPRRLRGGPGGAARPLQVSTKGGPYSHAPAAQRNGQFGVLRVTDDGTTLTARFEGHRYTGGNRAALVPGIAVTMRCTGEACSVVT